jgi:hypothetical protein
MIFSQPQSWWAREDSNLQPDRYERGHFTGKIEKIEVIWYVTAHLMLGFYVRCWRFIGETLAVVLTLEPYSAGEKEPV